MLNRVQREKEKGFIFIQGQSSMAKETIGLDIGTHSVKLVSFTRNAQGLFLTHARMKEIPPGKEEEDRSFLSEVVKALFREAGLSPGKARLTVSGPEVTIRRLLLPSMPKAELLEAARWELKEQLPFPVDSARVDFHVSREWVEGDSKKLDLIAVACPVQKINQVLAIAAKAGLAPTHLDVAPFALWNTLLHFHEAAKEEEIALIDLGAQRTGIYIFQKGDLQFSREIVPAGADLSRAIQEGIDPTEAPSLLFARAERIKHAIGIPVKGPYEKIEGESISIAKISFLLRPLLEKLVAEIVRSLDYYKSHFAVERVSRVFLTGGGANMKNIAAYLSDELHIPVERFNPLGQVSFTPQQIQAPRVEEVGPALAVAAGAALSQPQRIELLPPRESFGTRLRRGKTLSVLAALIVGILFASVVGSLNSRVTRLQKEYDTRMAQIKDLEVLPEKLAALKVKEMQLKQDLSYFSTTQILPGLFREVLREVRRLVPGNVTLTLLAVQTKSQPFPQESPVKEARELQLTGLAFGSDAQCLAALAQIIEGIEKSPRFKNARLVAADENRSYTRPGVQFVLVCEILLEGAKGKGSI
ncbi:MAG: type IV pilus assembly protein PilM [Syntrophaceae bacterium]|nr:type IV pilus assembly protein PilM [Syntrophaceae bacterium]